MNKNVIIITTKNDEVISGRCVNEDKEYITLYIYNNNYITIPKNEIECIYNTNDYKNKFDRIYKEYYKNK